MCSILKLFSSMRMLIHLMQAPFVQLTYVFMRMIKSYPFVFYTSQVWDLQNFQCLQTLNGHTNNVMAVLCWDCYLLSASLDKTLKVGALFSFSFGCWRHGHLLTMYKFPCYGFPFLPPSLTSALLCLIGLVCYGKRGH